MKSNCYIYRREAHLQGNHKLIKAKHIVRLDMSSPSQTVGTYSWDISAAFSIADCSVSCHMTVMMEDIHSSARSNLNISSKQSQTAVLYSLHCFTRLLPAN